MSAGGGLAVGDTRCSPPGKPALSASSGHSPDVPWAQGRGPAASPGVQACHIPSRHRRKVSTAPASLLWSVPCGTARRAGVSIFPPLPSPAAPLACRMPLPSEQPAGQQGRRPVSPFLGARDWNQAWRTTCPLFPCSPNPSAGPPARPRWGKGLPHEASPRGAPVAAGTEPGAA